MCYIQTITFRAPEKKAQGNSGTLVSMFLTTFGIIAKKTAFTQLFPSLCDFLHAPNAPGLINMLPLDH